MEGKGEGNRRQTLFASFSSWKNSKWFGKASPFFIILLALCGVGERRQDPAGSDTLPSL